MGSAKVIGSKIKQRREELGLSQEALAEKVDKRQAEISAYENDSRSMLADTLIGLSIALKVPVTYFFGDSNNDTEIEEILLHIFRSLSSTEAKRGAIELLTVYQKYAKDE